MPAKPPVQTRKNLSAKASFERMKELQLIDQKEPTIPDLDDEQNKSYRIYQFNRNPKVKKYVSDDKQGGAIKPINLQKLLYQIKGEEMPEVIKEKAGQKAADWPKPIMIQDFYKDY